MTWVWKLVPFSYASWVILPFKMPTVLQPISHPGSDVYTTRSSTVLCSQCYHSYAEWGSSLTTILTLQICSFSLEQPQAGYTGECVQLKNCDRLGGAAVLNCKRAMFFLPERILWRDMLVSVLYKLQNLVFVLVSTFIDNVIFIFAKLSAFKHWNVFLRPAAFLLLIIQRMLPPPLVCISPWLLTFTFVVVVFNFFFIILLNTTLQISSILGGGCTT